MSIKVVCAMLVLALLSCAGLAGNPSFITPSKDYHIVKKGETLFSISQQHNIAIERLRLYNGIKENRIFAGQKIYLTPRTEQTSYVTTKDIPQSGYHRVKKGETLFRISRMYNLEVIDLVEYNELESFDIYVNQKLWLVDGHQQEESRQYSWHRVKRGEYLSGIAKKYGMALAEIKKLNELKSDKILRGQKLRVKAIEQQPAETQPQTTQVTTHTVKRGEFLSKIAKQYGMSLAQIKKLNNLSKTTVYPGQKLKVTGGAKAAIAATSIHTVKSGEHLTGLANKYNTTIAHLKKLNNLKRNTLYKGQKLKVPATGSTAVTHTTKRPPAGFSSKLYTPVNGTLISCFGLRSGRLHKGIDLAAPEGEPIYAALDGAAVFVGQQRGYGNVVILEHDDGLMTVYAHNETNLVRLGDEVTKGQPVATVGQTGNAEGPHVHFELRINGKAVDPQRYLR